MVKSAGSERVKRLQLIPGQCSCHLQFACGVFLVLLNSFSLAGLQSSGYVVSS